MKYFVALVILTAVTLTQGSTEEQRQKAVEYSKECQQITGISDETIQKIRHGEFIDDPKVKEQLFCFNKKAGFITDDGEIQFSEIKAKLGDDLGEERVDLGLQRCKDAKGATPQETAYIFFKCFAQETRH